MNVSSKERYVKDVISLAKAKEFFCFYLFINLAGRIQEYLQILWIPLDLFSLSIGRK